LIAQGGIGSPFDRLNLNLSLFREQNVPIKGVIINKVHPDKLKRVEVNLGKALDKIGIPLLGTLPYDRMLSLPLISTIKKVIQGNTLINGHRLNNQVADILAGSLVEIDEFTYFQNLLLITSYDNLTATIQKIKQAAAARKLDYAPLSGVIITRLGKQADWHFDKDFDASYLMENEIPVLTTAFDTYDTVIKISQIEVKINMQTPWKVNRAIELIEQNVDIDQLL